MVAVTRKDTIVYGGYTVGAGTTQHLHEVKEWDVSPLQTVLTFALVIREADRATFLATDASFRAAFQKQDQDLVVTVNGSNWRSYTQAGNQGYNARPFVSALLTHRTERSCGYRVSIALSHPATWDSRDGRVDSRTGVTQDESERRTVTIEATYTANPTGPVDAFANAKAAGNFPALITQRLSEIGGTFEPLVGAQYGYDDNDKNVQAVAVYQEVLANQASGVLDNPAIVNPTIVTTTQTFAAKATRGSKAQDLKRITITFDASVRASVSTDLEDVWTSTVRPYLIELGQAQGATFTAVESENKNLDWARNRLSPVMTFITAPSTIIRSVMLARESFRSPENLVDVASGRLYDRDVHVGPARLVRQVILSTLEVSGGSLVDPFKIAKLANVQAPLKKAVQASVGSKFRIVDTDDQVDVSDLGDAGAGEGLIPTIERVQIVTLERADVKRVETGGGAQATRERGTGYEGQLRI